MASCLAEANFHYHGIGATPTTRIGRIGTQSQCKPRTFPQVTFRHRGNTNSRGIEVQNPASCDILTLEISHS